MAGKRARAYRVRPVAPADEPQWRRLWQAYCDYYAVAVPSDVTGVLWQRIMDYRTPVHALVAEKASPAKGVPAVIGFANYVLHPFTWGTDFICYLEDLFVAEEERGGGAGRAMIEALIALSKENGWPRLYWHTHEDNHAARALYDRFTPVDPFVRYVVKVR